METIQLNGCGFNRGLIAWVTLATALGCAFWGCDLVFPFKAASQGDDAAAADARPHEGGFVTDAPLFDIATGRPCTTLSDCDDGLDCTVDLCEEDTCQRSTLAGQCAIDGLCHVRYENHSTDPCLRCDPDKNAFTWTEMRRCVRTIAGGYKQPADPNDPVDGPAASARFYFPEGLAVDPLTGVYVADSNTHRIRLIAQGMVSTYTGSAPGQQSGPLAEATFTVPTGVAFDGKGRLWIADRNNSLVRVIDQGQVVTQAGPSDGFDQPHALAVDPSGKVYVADIGNHSIFVIDSTSPTRKLAGNDTPGFQNGLAAEAQFYWPKGIAVGPSGEVYVADWGNNRIRVIKDGHVDTVAGTGEEGEDNGDGEDASFRQPAGVAVDSNGVIYVADRNNNQIRMITPTEVGFEVSLLAGKGSGNQDGPAQSASFDHPVAVAVAPDGTLYVSDYHGHVIRSITPE